MSQEATNRVLDAAVRLLAQEGLSGITPVAKVEAAANVAPGTIDRLYSDHADFTHAIWERLVSRELSALAKAAAKRPGSVEQLADLESVYIADSLSFRSEAIKARLAIVLRPPAVRWLVQMSNLLAKQAYPLADDGAGTRLITLYRALTAIAVCSGQAVGPALSTELFEAAIKGPGDGSWAFSPNPEDPTVSGLIPSDQAA